MNDFEKPLTASDALDPRVRLVPIVTKLNELAANADADAEALGIDSALHESFPYLTEQGIDALRARAAHLAGRQALLSEIQKLIAEVSAEGRIAQVYEPDFIEKLLGEG